MSKRYHSRYSRSRPRNLFLSLLVMAVVFFADQEMKNRIESEDGKSFPKAPEPEALKDKVEFRKVHNHGYSMGRPASSNREVIRNTSAAVFVSGLIFVWEVLTGASFPSLLALAMALGGAFSNLYDRIVRGFVVDYIRFRNGRLSRWVFNLADMAIVNGLALWLILCIL